MMGNARNLRVAMAEAIGGARKDALLRKLKFWFVIFITSSHSGSLSDCTQLKKFLNVTFITSKTITTK